MLTEHEILSKIQSVLGEAPDNIKFDSRFHEFGIDGKKGKGRYIAHRDGSCTFWDWRDRDNKYTVWPDSPNDAAQETQRTAAREAARYAEHRAELRRATVATWNAAAIWNAAPAAPPDHSYLVRKQIDPHIARLLTPEAASTAPAWLQSWIQSNDLLGSLILPVGQAGTLASLQFIHPNGEKKQLPHGTKQDGRAILGRTAEAETILIAEGFATAASIQEATGCPVVIAFDAGNLPKVAANIHREHPQARLIVAADNDIRAPDEKCQTNTGIEAARAAERLTGCLVAIPRLPNGGKCDFNDVAVALGHTEAARQLFSCSPAPEKVDELPTAAAAAGELRAALRRFLDRVGTPEQPDLAIRAAAGLGKSTQALQEIHARGLVADYFVPSFALAKEQAARLPAGAAVAIRGRTHVDADNPPLCAKHEAATALQKVGLGQLSAPLLCGKIDPTTGRRPCPHARECGYLKQFNDPAPIRFYAHEWLPLPERNARTPQVAVVDESFRDSIERHRSWEVADLFAAGKLYRTLAAAVADGNLIEVATAHNAALDAALDAAPPWANIEIHPEMNVGEVLAKLAKMENDTDERRRLSFLRAVKRAVDGNNPVSIWHHSQGEVGKIHAAWLAPVTFVSSSVPRLYIDASLSAGIVDVVSPGVEVLNIAARRNARVIQVADTALSRHRLDSNNDHLASRMIEFITRQTGENPNGAVIAPKSWLDAHGSRLPCCIKQAHYGALRGLNTMEQADWLVVIGRNEPPPWAVEKVARAWFAGDMEPGTVTREQTQLAAKSGDVATITQTTFQDPRCREILESIREQESLQAVDRLRLIHATQPKKIFLLSNLPLPGLPPDELATLDELLLPGRIATVILRDGVVVGPALLASRHPDLFISSDAARRELRTFKDTGLNRSIPYISSNRETTYLKTITYRTRGTKGKPRVAWVPVNLPANVATAQLAEMHGAEVSILEVKIMDEARPPAPIDRLPPELVPDFIPEPPPAWEPPPPAWEPIPPDPEPWQFPIRVPTEPLYLPNARKVSTSPPEMLPGRFQERIPA
ncbi:toprim domain-containing protein [Ferrovibrio sp.]|uniref:toprim domain-containing protein n=1 Tax=Ferrovibrio sp. TaxID=1917215 RepID=UPI000CCA5569|nr:toprim domain-containing protein [Ferrovibrio sp.]PJI37368.1 MAG: hypothetical protein CTR53_20575 [Ferrovibrio sp.]